jgi:hypothetical protein
MSTTRPYPPGDRGPQPAGASSSPRATAVNDVSPALQQVTGASNGGAPVAPEVRQLNLAGESGVVPLARDFTRQALHAWGWLPSSTDDGRAAAEDVLLIVSELVTNACLHAEGPEALTLTFDRKAIRVAVSDRGEGQPTPRTPHQAGRPGGHGMFIVQRLSMDWGVAQAPEVPGKIVWADLARPTS